MSPKDSFHAVDFLYYMSSDKSSIANANLKFFNLLFTFSKFLVFLFLLMPYVFIDFVVFSVRTVFIFIFNFYI